MLPFNVAGGTTTGGDHRGILRPKNNQDFYAIAKSGDAICAVVCDGCGSGPFSEFGAALLANIVSQSALHMTSLSPYSMYTFLCAKYADVLATVFHHYFDSNILIREKIVHDYLLATLVMVHITEEVTTLMMYGDGAWVLNSTYFEHNEAGNAPNYPAYLALGKIIQPVKYVQIPTSDLNFVIIGSDGICSIEDAYMRGATIKSKPCPYWSDFLEDSIFQNSDSINRKLAVMAKDKVTLKDDTTLISIKRINNECNTPTV